MQKPTLLGCICLYYDECIRNCRTNLYESYNPDPDIQPIFIHCNPACNDMTSIICERVEDEEDQRMHQEIIGIEAWSNGRLRIWFTHIGK